MDLKDSLIRGSVLIVHRIHEGKHQYEVDNVVKIKKRKGPKPFVRKGDILVEVNDVELKDVTPEDLVQKLADGNPKLTVHNPIKMKAHSVESCPENLMHPVSKESATLSFRWEMRREEDLDDNEIETEGEGKEDGEAEEDICKEEDGEDGQDVLIVTMKKTSISVVAGRGCSTGSSCQGCQEAGCTLKDVVLVTESSTVTLANMTLYKYKEVPNTPFRGVPVVLNFTGSDCFLRCFRTDEGVHLQVETYEKQQLKEICKTNQEALSFLFYMRSDKSNQRTFESALHLGWFIKIVNTDIIELGAVDGQEEDDVFFHVIILKQNS